MTSAVNSRPTRTFAAASERNGADVTAPTAIRAASTTRLLGDGRIQAATFRIGKSIEPRRLSLLNAVRSSLIGGTSTFVTISSDRLFRNSIPSWLYMYETGMVRSPFFDT